LLLLAGGALRRLSRRLFYHLPSSILQDHIPWGVLELR